MDIAGLQKAIGTMPDGKWGRASRSALLDKLTNRSAPAVTAGQLQAFADRLGVTLRQLAAVAKVESSGAGFDHDGRPKILFERHVFHRLTGGRFTPAPFSQAVRGGYEESSWNKLLFAAGCDPDAAFAAASWGKFQVMGMHWPGLGYSSAYAMAVSAATSEAAQYDMLCRFIEGNRLQEPMRALSTDPNACRAFARAYNGPAYADNEYHLKLARELR